MKIDKANFEGISQTTPLPMVAGAPKNVEAKTYGFRVEMNPLPIGTLTATTDLGAFDVIPGHFYKFVDPFILHSITDTLAETIRLTVLSGIIIPLAGGGGGGGAVPTPAFSFIDFNAGVATQNYTTPNGAACLRVELTGNGATKPVFQANWVLNNDPLIFYDEAGNGYFSADFSVRGVYYLEVNPVTQRVAPGVITFKQVNPAASQSDVTLIPSFIPRLNELKSLTYNAYDMGIVLGTDTTATFAAANGFTVPNAGAKAIDGGIVGNPANTCAIILSLNPRNGSLYDSSNVQISHATGNLAGGPLPGPGVVMIHAGLEGSFGADNGQAGWSGPGSINQRWYSPEFVNFDTKGSTGTPMVITDIWLTLRF